MTTFKKKTANKLISLLTVTAIMLSLFVAGGFSAFAQDEEILTLGYFNYTVTSDGVCIEEYTGDGGDVSIPNTIDDTPVTAIASEAFWYCEDLTAVDLPDYLEFIGARAFQGCKSLQYAEIPDTVVEIGDAAFDGCSKLSDINIPADLVYVGGYAFDGTQWIKKFEDNDSIILSGRLFYRYSGDASVVNIPEGVQSISANAFSHNSNLTYVSIPESMLFIGDYSFFNCPNLTSVSIPDKVYYMGAYSFGYTSINEDGSGDTVDGFVLYANEGTLGEEYAAAYELEYKERSKNPTPDEMPAAEVCVAKDVSDSSEGTSESRWLGNTNSVVALVIIIASCVVIIGGLYFYFMVVEKKRKAAKKNEQKNNNSKKKKKKKSGKK